MSKLYYIKIDKCSECPKFFGGSSPHCIFTGDKVEPNNIPSNCHLIEYMEKIEANETNRVWLLKSK